MMKKVFIAILCVCMMLITVSCGKSKVGNESKMNNVSVAEYQLQKPLSGDTVAIFKTSEGSFKVKLFPEEAPRTVENFTTHAKNGYYNGLTFHRIIEEFMVQGGDPLGNGTGGESIWGDPFKDEFSPRLYHYRGALSMANSGENTNGSQFFIVQKSSVSQNEIEYLEFFHYLDGVIAKYKELGGTMWLDNNHSVFGQVYEGMDVVDKIAAVPASEEGIPTEAVTIETIEIQIIGE